MGPLILNAFDLIILSQGLNLATLFDRGKVEFFNKLFISTPTSADQFLKELCALRFFNQTACFEKLLGFSLLFNV